MSWHCIPLQLEIMECDPCETVVLQRGEFENQPKDLSLLDVGMSQDMDVDLQISCFPRQVEAPRRGSALEAVELVVPQPRAAAPNRRGRAPPPGAARKKSSASPAVQVPRPN